MKVESKVYEEVHNNLAKDLKFTPPTDFVESVKTLTAEIEKWGFRKKQLFAGTPLPITDEVRDSMLKLRINPNKATDIAYDFVEELLAERGELVGPIIKNPKLWDNSVLAVIFDGERVGVDYSISRDYSFVAGRLVATLPRNDDEVRSVKIGRKLNDRWRNFPVFTGGLPPLGLAQWYGTGNEQTILVPMNRIIEICQFSPNP